MIASIARRRTFDDLRRDGRRVRHGSVRLSFLPLETARPQVAFAIGRSFGNAVDRNRGRRRLRAAFVEAVDEVEESHPASPGRATHLEGAFLLSGSHRLLTDPFPTLVEDVKACLEDVKACLEKLPDPAVARPHRQHRPSVIEGTNALS